MLTDKGGWHQRDRDQSLTRFIGTRKKKRTEFGSAHPGPIKGREMTVSTHYILQRVMGCDIFVCVGGGMAWPCHRAKPFRGGKTKAEWLGRRIHRHHFESGIYLYIPAEKKRGTVSSRGEGRRRKAKERESWFVASKLEDGGRSE